MVILICEFSLKSFTSKAVEDTDVTYKYFKSYEVDNDDTLWSIAKEHIDYQYYNDVNEYLVEEKNIEQLFKNIFIAEDYLKNLSRIRKDKDVKITQNIYYF
mgnify:CR=1 FL=1